MSLRSPRPPAAPPAFWALLAGLVLLAPAAYGQGGLTASGMEATPMALTLDHSATSVKQFGQFDVEPDLGKRRTPPTKAPTPGWTTVLFDDAEGNFPSDNSWDTFDANADSGEDYWDDVSCRSANGSWSIWCADIGTGDDCVAYDNDMSSWMIYGPFSLADAADAQAEFLAWSEVEDTFDSIFVGASINGTNFFGASLSEDFDWTLFEFDLTNVFTLGNLAGEANVWLAFVFSSDFSVAIDEGVYLDDILIEKRIDSGTCVPDATTLCLPGYNRFKVTVYFETVQGAGNMGDAQAIPLDSLGLTSGGLFYFINPTDPQFLVKVLDGCPLNNRWWVFYAATTNVGFDLTVTDTQSPLIPGVNPRVYNNPDINAAPPVQDTQAFATCP